MKNKHKILPIMIIGVFLIQLVYVTNTVSANTSFATNELSEQKDIREKSIYREEMKIIVGTPDQVDVGDPITVYAAGLRDAKAAYIKPTSVIIKLLHFDESATNVELSEDARTISTHTGYYNDNNEWKNNDVDNAVQRLDNDYIYYTSFEPLNQSIDIKVQIIMTWISPWHEELTSMDEKNVHIGEWRNFENLLATNADSVQNEFDEMQIDNIVIRKSTTELGQAIENITSAIENIEVQIGIGGADPSELHFYLLNISTITDLRIGSGSYIDKLRWRDPAAYTKYVQRLNEVNNAFIDSLKYLNNSNIPYHITNVNYTYDAHLLGNGLNDYDYTSFGNGLIDGDWDNEHLDDCSFEFLLEGRYWSGHPYLSHDIINISLDDLSAGTYDIQLGENQVDESFSISNAFGITDGVPNMPIVADNLDIYDGYVKLYNKTLSGEYEEVNVVVVNSPINTFQFSDNLNDGYLSVTPKGGFIQDNRSVIVNLMDEFFPYLSRIVSIPRGLPQPIYDENYNSTFVNETGLNQYYLPLDHPYSIKPIYNTLSMHTELDGETLNLDSIECEINSPENFNITDYIFRLSGLSDGLPFYINPLSKPMQTFVYDNNTIGDSYDLIYTDKNFTDYLQIETTKINLYEIKDNEWCFPLFNFIDTQSGITSQKGNVFPTKTKVGSPYMTNDWGRRIETFFNLTIPDGNGGWNFVMPDGCYPHEDAWTFRYINRDVLGEEVNAVPAEFQLSPFESMDTFSPIGIFLGGNMMLIQNSMANLSNGFMYSFGLIFNTYERVYFSTRETLTYLQQVMGKMNRTNAVQAIGEDILKLTEAWDTLNLTLLDKISRKSLNYMSNSSNEYVSENGNSFMYNRVQEALVIAENLSEISSRSELTGKYIDGEMDKLPQDVQKLGLLSELGDWLDGHIIPFLTKMGEVFTNYINNALQSFNNFKETFIEAANDITNNVDEWFDYTLNNMNDTIDEWSDNIKDGTASFANTLGSAFHSIGTTIGIISGAAIGLALGVACDLNPAKITAGTICASALGGFVGYLISGGDNAINAFNNVGNKIADAVSDVGKTLVSGLDKVKNGVSLAMDTTVKALNTSFTAVDKALESVGDTLLQIWKQMLRIIQLSIDQIKLILGAVEDTLESVYKIFADVVDQIGKVFTKITSMISKIGGFIVDLIGKSYEYVLNLTSDIFTEVKDNLEKTLLENKAFVKVADTLYPMLVKMRRNAGLVSYATQYGEMNEDLMLKWVDVFQPASIIQSADTGFFIWQLGSEFAKRLYFITTLNGTLVDLDEISFTIQRYADFNTEFGIDGEGVLESNLPVQQYYDNSTGQPINGIYYIDFFQGTNLDWFKENKNGTGLPDFNSPAPEGFYMTVINATYTDTLSSKSYNTMWAERTYLFDKRYIEDAFPIIDLVNDGQNNNDIIEVVAGGEPIILEVEVENEMWSQPDVSLIVTLAENKSGIPISEWEYPTVRLNDEDGDVIKTALSWSPSRFSPEGYHTMIITVQEYNGDKTFIIAQVHIRQDNVFFFFLYSWESILVVILVAVVVSLIAWFLNRKKASKLTLSKFYKKDISSKMIKECTEDLAKQGKCILPK